LKGRRRVLAAMRVPPEMFRFTTGERAGLYVAILHAFGEANERLETALGLDDVRLRLRTVGWLDPLDDQDLTDALGVCATGGCSTSPRTTPRTTGPPTSTSGATSSTP
jgi:hypothetical protein